MVLCLIIILLAVDGKRLIEPDQFKAYNEYSLYIEDDYEDENTQKNLKYGIFKNKPKEAMDRLSDMGIKSRDDALFFISDVYDDNKNIEFREKVNEYYGDSDNSKNNLIYCIILVIYVILITCNILLIKNNFKKKLKSIK